MTALRSSPTIVAYERRRQLSAEVTGTIGIVVRAVDAGRSPAQAKEIARRIDRHGLHMTAEVRETADDLIEAAAEED